MLRTLFKTDMSQLLVIEQAAQAAPWIEDTFKTCFQEGYLGWVIEKDKLVIGFIIVSIRAEECHVLNLCVTRDFQHQGYGRQLLKQALAYAKQQGIGVAYLEVRRSNARAIALYRKERFQLVGARKDYYPIASGDTDKEDALVFAKSLVDDRMPDS